MIAAVQRGVLADAALGAGATMLILESTSGTQRSVFLTVLGIGLVVLGLGFLWGVPRPSFRLRTASSLAGLFFGYAVVAPEGPGTWAAVAVGILLLAGILHRVRPARR